MSVPKIITPGLSVKGTEGLILSGSNKMRLLGEEELNPQL